MEFMEERDTEELHEEERKIEKTVRTVFVILLLLLTAALTALITTLSVTRRLKKEADAYTPLAEAEEIIRDYYYFLKEDPETDLTEDCVYNALLGVMVGLGDVYADYMTAEEFDEMLESDSGEYTGIGIQVREPDETGSLISEVYEGSAAHEAGLLPGDIITAVNGEKTAGLGMNAYMALFTDGNDEADTLVLLRGTETFEVTLFKREVKVKRVEWEILPDGKGFIRLTEFLGDAANELAEAVEALEDAGAPGLIIDLRDNPGGDLDVVLGTVDCILDKGDLIATVRNREGDETVYRAKTSGLDLPIAVLVNGDSASGSEMFSGALQDNGRAVIVGTRTFGKGIVQTFYRLRSNGGWVKLTTDAYFTPSGKCIHGEGIEPDIIVEQPLPEGVSYLPAVDIPREEDVQLQAAVRVLDELLAKNAA